MANSDNQASSQVKLISQCFVKPKHEVEASKQPYYLGVVDITFLRFDQIQKGLLFSTNKPKNIQPDFVDKLKESLAVSLVHFYPLAGRLSTQEFPDENKKWVYIDCTKGPGALLVNATADYTVSDILTSVDVHPVVQFFFDLGEKSINYDGHTRPLLSIQVTNLIDGIFIGFTMNHSVVDGTSQWNFINSLSEIFLQLTKSSQGYDIIPISQKPVFKTYFPVGCDSVLKLPKEYTDKFISQSKDKTVVRERIFHFSSRSIRKLKVKANDECGVDNISSFQALSAFMWRSITRARNLQPEFETCCPIVMNVRPRFSPQLTNDYFGNYVITDQAMCNVGDLLKESLGWAAMLIHQAIVGQDDEKVRGFYEMAVKYICEGQIETGRRSPFYTPNPVVMGGSARFPIYETEFGFGKAEAVLAGYCNKEDGKVTVSPGREGGGSVDLEVCLTPKTMSALELDQDFMSLML